MRMRRLTVTGIKVLTEFMKKRREKLLKVLKKQGHVPCIEILEKVGSEYDYVITFKKKDA